jgi:hypothetical protein
LYPAIGPREATTPKIEATFTTLADGAANRSGRHRCPRVDHDIESTVRVSCVLDQGLPVQRIGDVAGDCRNAITALMHDVVEEVTSQGSQQHVSPSTMQHGRTVRPSP